MSKWGPRGIVRGATVGVCMANVISGGMVYALERREQEERGTGEGNTA